VADVIISSKADALRKFFRDLPEPLFTYELYEAFLSIFGKYLVSLENRTKKITISSIKDYPDNQLNKVKELISKLPTENAKLLLYLLKFLHQMRLFQVDGLLLKIPPLM